MRRAFTCPRCSAVLARVVSGNKPALVVATGVDPVTDILYREVMLHCPCGGAKLVKPKRVQVVMPERRAA